ncbi:MAG: hypothetical protein AB1505_18645 [Candidatus Latescibacterota bacterium]
MRLVETMMSTLAMARATTGEGWIWTKGSTDRAADTARTTVLETADVGS